MNPTNNVNNHESSTNGAESTTPVESEQSLLDYVRENTACCLDADESMRLETNGKTIWQPLPCTERISPYVWFRLHDMMRRGEIASLLVDPPGEHAVHFVHADVAAVIREFAFLLTDDSHELEQ